MMRDLFDMDTRDYNPDGKVFSRPSVRAVIDRDGKVLLIYSQKYDYYKFPGGGINENETREDALIREVKEESGYRIIRESIREFGRVLRRQRDSFDENQIFEQENLYYFCRVLDDVEEVSLDAYEAEEGFIPVWMEPFEASCHNHYSTEKGGDPVMIKREEKVLDLLDLELRKRDRKAREDAKIKELGELDYAGMLAFVEKKLEETGKECAAENVDFPYDRFEHTKRVLGWAKRLYDAAADKDGLRYEELITAAIFHDVGRNFTDKVNTSHAKAGVPITREYLLSHGFSPERTEYICSLVGAHSDKYRMREENLDKNLLLLMEADLLDDMGAQGIVMDCMITERRNPQAGFFDCLDHITRFTYRQQQNNPMVSPEGRRFWEEKTRIVEEFVTALRKDLGDM